MIPVFSTVCWCIATGIFSVMLGVGVSFIINPRETRAQRKVIELEERLLYVQQKLSQVEWERDQYDRTRTEWSRAASSARQALFDAEKQLGAIRTGLESKGDAPKAETTSAT